MTPLDTALLQAGDTLLYRPAPFSFRRPLGWLFGRLIARKTWHAISHVEVYIGATRVSGLVNLHGETWGGPTSVASRDGLGVDWYPFRSSELAYVLRPVSDTERCDLDAGMRWFRSVQGQGYDWLGLTRFVRTSITPSKTRMFCSAFWLRFYRACGFNAFSPHVDADSIAPGEILDCAKLAIVWSDGKDIDYARPVVGV